MLPTIQVLLVLPYGARYAPPPDSLLAREGLRLGERDRATGQWPDDWSDDERERWHRDHREFHELRRSYHAARSPEKLSAPDIGVGARLVYQLSERRSWRRAFQSSHSPVAAFTRE